MRLCCALLLAVLFPSLLAAQTPAGAKACSVPAKPCDIDIFPNLPYYCGADAHPVRHQLDIYRPKGLKDRPVIFFVHGGTWVAGSKTTIQVLLLRFHYDEVGKFFARYGVVAVLPNYRLSPGVKHAEHVRDVARAFAWTCQHVQEFGGRPEQIFVAGHSAGGHLVSLLAMDDTYLRAEGQSPDDIRGVISVSGVYRVDSLPVLTRMLKPFQPDGKGVEVDAFRHMFGLDPAVRKQASPLTHVRPGLPPFLLINAGIPFGDFPGLMEMAREFGSALRENHCEVCQPPPVQYRNHDTVIFHATSRKDPVAEAMLQFIYGHIPPG